MGRPLYQLGLLEVSELLQQRRLSSSELTQAILFRIAAEDVVLGSYLFIAEEYALTRAEAMQAELVD